MFRKEIFFEEHDKIAIIAPHPDDECLFAASPLLYANDRTDVYVVTDGRYGNPDVAPEEEMAVRKNCFIKEMEYVKPNNYFWLGVCDGRVMEGARDAKVIDFTQYTKVFLPSFDSLHPDHRACAYIYLKEIDKQDAQCMCFYSEMNRPFRRPTHYVDITNDIERKKKMISFHEDQIIQEEIVIALNRFRGAQMQELTACKYAECFLKAERDDYNNLNFQLNC